MSYERRKVVKSAYVVCKFDGDDVCCGCGRCGEKKRQGLEEREDVKIAVKM